jgi:hypothetical protein
MDRGRFRAVTALAIAIPGVGGALAATAWAKGGKHKPPPAKDHVYGHQAN